MNAVGDAGAVRQATKELPDTGRREGFVEAIAAASKPNEESNVVRIRGSLARKAFDASSQLGSKRNEPLLVALASDFEKGSALVLRHVVHAKPTQLANADSSVRKEPDDEAVAVRVRRGFELLDLPARENVEDPTRQSRKLRLGEAVCLPFFLRPAQELPDVPDVRVAGVLGERGSSPAPGLQQVRREAVEGPLVQLGDVCDVCGSAPWKEDLVEVERVRLLDRGVGQAARAARGKVVGDEHLQRALGRSDGEGLRHDSIMR